MIKFDVLSIIRRPIYSIILLTVFILSGTMGYIGIVMWQSASDAKTNMYSALGISLLVSSGKGEGVSCNVMNDILSVDGVSGVTYTYSCVVEPIGFSNVKDCEGIDPMKKDAADNMIYSASSITLESSYDNRFYQNFARGISIMVAGRFPNNSERGAVVESRLAEQNNLAIGDILTVEYTNDMGKKSRTAMEILGIYESNAGFEILPQNAFSHGVFAFSPYNEVYCDINSYSELLGFSADRAPEAYVYLDSINNIDNVIGEIEALFSKNGYSDLSVMDFTKFQYEILCQNVESLYHSAKTIVFYVTSISIIVLLLFVSLYAKSLICTNGLLISIGVKKHSVAMHQLLQIYLIGAVGMFFSIALGSVLINVYGGNLLPETSHSGNNTASFITSSNVLPTVELGIGNSITALLFLAILVLGVAVIAGLYVGIYSLIIKPREILQINL